VGRLCPLQSRCIVVAEDLFRVFWRKHSNGVIGPWSSVRFSRSSVPPDCTEEANERGYGNSIVHVASPHRLHCGEEEDDTDEDDPDHRNSVDRFAPLAHSVRTRVELDLSIVPSVGNDNGNVAYVQGWSGDVEDGRDGQRAADTYQVETAAKGHNQPDSINWRLREAVDLAPKPVCC
jgi:hypothetical protein